MTPTAASAIGPLLADVQDEAPDACITLTKAEYEALIAGAPKQTVTVDAAEYNSLQAKAAAADKTKAELDRYAVRCRELESALRREQNDHREEIDQAMAALKKAGMIKPPSK